MVVAPSENAFKSESFRIRVSMPEPGGPFGGETFAGWNCTSEANDRLRASAQSHCLGSARASRAGCGALAATDFGSYFRLASAVTKFANAGRHRQHARARVLPKPWKGRAGIRSGNPAFNQAR